MQIQISKPVVERTEVVLDVGDKIAIPDNVWVFDKETNELLDVTEIQADRAHTIVLVPMAAGG